MKAGDTLENLLNGFSGMAEQSLMMLEQAKEAGCKIIGIYCIFAPVEIIRAAGAVPVGLCGKRAEPIAAAEADLPANLCPLIKSSYGYAITGTCPFFCASDAVIGENTCDGKKKMYEYLGHWKPLHVMQLPYAPFEPHVPAFWSYEIDRLVAFLEDLTGNRVTTEKLRQEIRIQNDVRRLLCELHALNTLDDAVPISGSAMLAVQEAKNFWPDAREYALRLEALLSALKARSSQSEPKRRRRILLTGTPIGKGSDKVLRLIEEAGAVVVAMENCTGLKSVWTMVDEENPDPLAAIAQRYRALPCACMTPNLGRLSLVDELVARYRVEGIVDLSWHACHTYMIESKKLALHVQSNSRVPVLHLSTDYGSSDVGSLRTRIEAFLEML